MHTRFTAMDCTSGRVSSNSTLQLEVGAVVSAAVV
jgi:hypothetical protein